jgi:putative transposase
MHALIKDSGMPRARACKVLAVARATGYRHAQPAALRQGARNASHRRLSQAQRAAILTVLHSERFCDQTPAHTYHTLLGEGIFHASIRTMQRLLKEAGESRDRRPIRPAQTHAVPRLQATGPNQVWTWDITKLALRKRGAWLYLYVLIDLYSRYVVGWMIAPTENSALACRFVASCAANHPVAPHQLTVHQDRGSPMTAKNFIDLLAELKIDSSHSRPRVSNDNAFSEAHFKTLKTQPDYPGYFDHESDARRWCGDFIDWYNDEHQHSGLNGHIPADVFYGRAVAITAIKQAALDDAYRRHPERFVNGAPRAKAPPDVVSINPLPASVINLPFAMRNNEIQKVPAQAETVPSALLLAQQSAAQRKPNEVPKLH